MLGVEAAPEGAKVDKDEVDGNGDSDAGRGGGDVESGSKPRVQRKAAERFEETTLVEFRLQERQP
jgi:hypothetical protein